MTTNTQPIYVVGSEEALAEVPAAARLHAVPDPEPIQLDDGSSRPATRSPLRERLHAAMTSGDPRLGRLAQAGTSVTFAIRGEENDAVTMLLDRTPPVLTDKPEPSEITIELDRDQAERFTVGTLSLPPRLLHGHVSWRGPVRKYLIVDPVLRALLADLAAT